jgi:hypothetical protein
MITDEQIREAAGIDLHPADVDQIRQLLPAAVSANVLQVEVHECLAALLEASQPDASLSAAERNW